jgi:hypothetical protein
LSGIFAPVTFFCAGMTRTEKQAKEAVDNLSKKEKQAVSALCFDFFFFLTLIFAGVCEA